MYLSLALAVVLLAALGGCDKPATPLAEGDALPSPTGSASAQAASSEQAQPGSVHDFTVRAIDGQAVDLSQYRGQVLLIVNVASRCGHTPQYAGLQELHSRYHDRGLVVLGFPANNFGNQEPGSDAEVQAFCTERFHVTFPMFSKLSVKGPDQHPLYAYLTTANPDTAGEVEWNFAKFLVGPDGRVVARFKPAVQPTSQEVVSVIESVLRQ